MTGSELIGKQLLDIVLDNKGNRVLLQEPNMATYIINTRRLATPIYPHDANTITSLLDIHPNRPAENECAESQPLQIFEAGTGMGSLTLHLAKAIHAANPPLEPLLRQALCEASLETPTFDQPLRPSLQTELAEMLQTYRDSRHAVIHTLDNRPEHSRQAYKLLRNFRRAQYLCSVDFHVGTIKEFLSARLQESDGQPFLSRAILDIPATFRHADTVIDALLPNGLLIIFVPSISQVAEFQKWVGDNRQPVRCEKVLELPVSTSADGTHDSGGGRPWDVKTVTPREDSLENGQPVQIMRPKVGDRVVGGGFIALFRRWPVEAQSLLSLAERTEAVDVPRT